jgi:hypothetical protein
MECTVSFDVKLINNEPTLAFKLLAPELFFFILAHPVYKM